MLPALIFFPVRADSDWRWHKYPVIRLDFSKQMAGTAEKLEVFLKEQMDYIASAHGFSLTKSETYSRFEELITVMGKNEKVVIGRPDSGDPSEQVLWLCKIAHKHGLSNVETILKREWRFGTSLKFIEGDGMSWEKMKEINNDLILHGFPPFAWGLYGVGGGLRNELARDNFSAKYALCAIGKKLKPVCKFSETLEKTTLPGPFKLLRNKEALESKKTIVFPYENGEDAMVDYFDGSDIWDPFKEGYMDDFNIIKARISEQMDKMPLSLSTEENHNYPASDKIKEIRIELLKKYAPKKLAQNYS